MRLNMVGVDSGLVPAGNPTTDILVHLDGATASVQVKSSSKHVEKPEAIFMHPERVERPDFLVIVLLGLGDDPGAARPVAYVLPREAVVILCRDFNDHHAKAPVTRMNQRARAYLEPHREAWHLVVQHLEAGH